MIIVVVMLMQIIVQMLTMALLILTMTMMITIMIHLPFITTTKWLISSYLRFKTQRVLTVIAFANVNILISLKEDLSVIEIQCVFT